MKKNIVPPILIFSILIFFSSCHKNSGTTTASGQVIDEQTGQPIPNATVILNESNPNSFSGGGGPIASYACDGDGKFSFSFDVSSDLNYYLDAAKSNANGEIYAHPVDQPYLDNGRKNKSFTLSLTPLVFIKFHIIDADSLPGSTLNISSPDFLNEYQKNLDKTIVMGARFVSMGNEVIWFTSPDQIKHDTVLHIAPLDTFPLTIYY
jgi:hypothetical protein